MIFDDILEKKINTSQTAEKLHVMFFVFFLWRLILDERLKNRFLLRFIVNCPSLNSLSASLFLVVNLFLSQTVESSSASF